MSTKPCQGGKCFGEARPRGGKIQLKSRRGVVGVKKFKKFPCQGQSCLAKMYKYSPKCTNSLPKCANSLPKFANSSSWQGKCHYDSLPRVVGQETVNKFPHWGVWQEKIWIFEPRNSCETPPHPNLSRQMVSRKKTPWLNIPDIYLLWSDCMNIMGFVSLGSTLKAAGH